MRIKLTELEATFVKRTSGTTMQSGVPLSEADGVQFLCPKCFHEVNTTGRSGGIHSVQCWFVGKVADDVLPGPGRWQPSGTGIEDLTFIVPPSDPKKTTSVLLTGGCCWHGLIVNGEATLTPDG